MLGTLYYYPTWGGSQFQQICTEPGLAGNVQSECLLNFARKARKKSARVFFEPPASASVSMYELSRMAAKHCKDVAAICRRSLEAPPCRHRIPSWSNKVQRAPCEAPTPLADHLNTFPCCIALASCHTMMPTYSCALGSWGRYYDSHQWAFSF